MLFGFYNYDVNCNGIEGNQITGLNQKTISNNVDYSCIIGDYSNDPLGGDLIVGLTEAQIKSYCNVISESFVVNVFHTSLPGQNKANYEAFDEPDYYNLSYQIEKNVDYNGFITKQAPDAEYDIDYDDFVFTTTQPGWVSVFSDNVATYPFGVSILGHPNYNYLFDQTYSNDPIHTQAIPLPAGIYYLEFYANGNATSWQYPYKFRLDWSPNNPTAIQEASENININISPNPVKDFANLLIENQKSINGYIMLQNEIGQVVYQEKIEGNRIAKQIDMTGLPDGVYFVVIGFENGFKTILLDIFENRMIFCG